MPAIRAADLPAAVTLGTGQGGLPVLRVAGRDADAEVYLHGAHVTAWRPAGQDPVLWLSAASRFAPGSAIRGGVPICFPWFGPAPGGRAPSHGFARLATWHLLDATDDGAAVTLVLGLTDADVTDLPGAGEWPHPFTLTYTVTVGAELTLALTVQNTGREPVVLEEALHTYLAVRDVTAVRVEGLDGAAYLDKAAGAGQQRTQHGPVTLTEETDRVYRSTAPTTVVDPAASRAVTVTKDGSASTVVWNPWAAKAAALPDVADGAWRSMVCVETANALDDAVTLDAGASHTMTARYAVAAQ